MKLALVVVTAALAVLLSASLGNASTPTRATSPAATVGTANSSLGRILVDGRDRTLYLFEKDTRGHSLCTGFCAAYWPPLLTHGKPTPASGANRSLLGTTRRADGTIQVTYEGHPLYRFVKDTKRGQTNGQGLNVFGAEWYALAPVGRKIEKANG